MTRAGDRGSVTAFVVMLVVTFLVIAGLAVDGARLVANHMRAADHAENAARVGAQEVTSLRAGQTRLDQARAAAAARHYLSSRSLQGTASATPNRVTVTVTVTTSFTLLRLAGLQSRSTSATRSSDPVRG